AAAICLASAVLCAIMRSRAAVTKSRAFKFTSTLATCRPIVCAILMGPTPAETFRDRRRSTSAERTLQHVAGRRAFERSRRRDVSAWWRGDWWNAGEPYGERVAAIKDSEVSYGRWRNCGVIAVTH